METRLPVAALAIVLLVLSQSVVPVVHGAGSGPLAGSRTAFGCTAAVNLSNSTSRSYLPEEEGDPVAAGNNVYMAWSAGNTQIMFLSSHDAGKTFGTPIGLNVNPTRQAYGPRIATNGSDVYVAWQAINTNGSSSVLFRVSTDNGSTWGTTVALAGAGGSLPADVWLPQIQAWGSNVYVAWAESISGLAQVYIRVSSDNGNTFGPAMNLSNDTERAWEPVLAVVRSNVYVAWDDLINAGNSEVYFRASSNMGATFGPVLNLSSAADFDDEPAISATGGSVYVVWHHVGVGDVGDGTYFRASQNRGSSFFPVVEFLSGVSGLARYTTVVSKGHNVYLAWRDNSSGSFDVLFAASHNNGGSFTPTVDLATNTGITSVTGADYLGDRPQLAVETQGVFATWAQNVSGNYEIFYNAITANGKLLGQNLNVSRDAGASTLPLIATSQNQAYLIWQDTSTASQVANTFYSVCLP